MRTTGTLEVLPIETCPKDTDAGETVNGSWFTPLPSTQSSSGGVDPLLANWRLPDVYPTAVGENVTVTSTLCPTASAIGMFKATAVNAELVLVIAETVTLTDALLVTVATMVSV